MLMLLFQLDRSQYAIPAIEVVEVAPLVRLQPLSMAPDFITGLFNYRGQHVPVIDLCKLIAGRFSENSITTRIILVQFRRTDGQSDILGLLAEQVTETISLDTDNFLSTGITLPDAPFLGKAAHTESGLIQQVNIEHLLPDPVKALLYPAETA